MIQRKPLKGKGFTLIEVLIGLALVGAAVLGLAELFTLAVLQNRQADRIANATFLAQQTIDSIRNMTADELNAQIGITEDDPIDLNSDGVDDFRRVRQILQTGNLWDVRVLVFSAEQIDPAISAASLVADPAGHKVRAQINTLISRGQP